MTVDLTSYGYPGYWMRMDDNRIASDYPRVRQDSTYRVKGEMFIDPDNYHTIRPNKNGVVYLYVGTSKLEKVDFFKLKIQIMKEKNEKD